MVYLGTLKYNIGHKKVSVSCGKERDLKKILPILISHNLLINMKINKEKETELGQRSKEWLDSNYKRLRALAATVGFAFLGTAVLTGSEAQATDKEALEKTNNLDHQISSVKYGVGNNSLPGAVDAIISFEDGRTLTLNNDEVPASANGVQESQTEPTPTEEPFSSIQVTVRREVNIRTTNGLVFAPLSSREAFIEVRAIGIFTPSDLPRSNQFPAQYQGEPWLVIVALNPDTGVEENFAVIASGIVGGTNQTINNTASLPEYTSDQNGNLVPVREIPEPSPTATLTPTSAPTDAVPLTPTSVPSSTIQLEETRTATPAPQETEAFPEIEETITVRFRDFGGSGFDNWKEVTVTVDQESLFVPLGPIARGQIPALDEFAQWDSTHLIRPEYYAGILIEVSQDSSMPEIKYLTFLTETKGGNRLVATVEMMNLTRIQEINNEFVSVATTHLTSTTAVIDGNQITTGLISGPIIPGQQIVMDLSEISSTDRTLAHTPQQITTIANGILNNWPNNLSMNELMKLVDENRIEPEGATLWTYGGSDILSYVP